MAASPPGPGPQGLGWRWEAWTGAFGHQTLWGGRGIHLKGLPVTRWLLLAPSHRNGSSSHGSSHVQRHRHRDTKRHTDIQRYVDTHIQKHTHRHTYQDIHRHTQSHTYTDTYKKTWDTHSQNYWDTSTGVCTCDTHPLCWKKKKLRGSSPPQRAFLPTHTGIANTLPRLREERRPVIPASCRDVLHKQAPALWGPVQWFLLYWQTGPSLTFLLMKRSLLSLFLCSWEVNVQPRKLLLHLPTRLLKITLLKVL